MTARMRWWKISDMLLESLPWLPICCHHISNNWKKIFIHQCSCTNKFSILIVSSCCCWNATNLQVYCQPCVGIMKATNWKDNFQCDDSALKEEQPQLNIILVRHSIDEQRFENVNNREGNLFKEKKKFSPVEEVTIVKFSGKFKTAWILCKVSRRAQNIKNQFNCQRKYRYQSRPQVLFLFSFTVTLRHLVGWHFSLLLISELVFSVCVLLKFS